MLEIAAKLPEAQLQRLGRVAVRLTAGEKTAVIQTTQQQHEPERWQHLRDQLAG